MDYMYSTKKNDFTEMPSHLTINNVREFPQQSHVLPFEYSPVQYSDCSSPNPFYVGSSTMNYSMHEMYRHYQICAAYGINATAPFPSFEESQTCIQQQRCANQYPLAYNRYVSESVANHGYLYYLSALNPEQQDECANSMNYTTTMSKVKGDTNRAGVNEPVTSISICQEKNISFNLEKGERKEIWKREKVVIDNTINGKTSSSSSSQPLFENSVIGFIGDNAPQCVQTEEKSSLPTKTATTTTTTTEKFRAITSELQSKSSFTSAVIECSNGTITPIDIEAVATSQSEKRNKKSLSHACSSPSSASSSPSSILQEVDSDGNAHKESRNDQVRSGESFFEDVKVHGIERQFRAIHKPQVCEEKKLCTMDRATTQVQPQVNSNMDGNISHHNTIPHVYSLPSSEVQYQGFNMTENFVNMSSNYQTKDEWYGIQQQRLSSHTFEYGFNPAVDQMVPAYLVPSYFSYSGETNHGGKAQHPMGITSAQYNTFEYQWNIEMARYYHLLTLGASGQCNRGLFYHQSQQRTTDTDTYQHVQGYPQAQNAVSENALKINESEKKVKKILKKIEKKEMEVINRKRNREEGEMVNSVSKSLKQLKKRKIAEENNAFYDCEKFLQLHKDSEVVNDMEWSHTIQKWFKSIQSFTLASKC
eukprot:g696.t1